jgi:hypothetical protein
MGQPSLWPDRGQDVLRIELDLAPPVRALLHYLAEQHTRILTRLDRMEHKMSQIGDFFDAEGVTLTNVRTALDAVAADVAVLLTKASGSGVFTPEEQAKADALSAGFAALSSAVTTLAAQVGDQDGSGTVAPPILPPPEV